MTMDMRHFQKMFDAHNYNAQVTVKDPNVLAAEKTGSMVSMGYYEKEFTVYGSCFYQNGVRQYIVSSKAEKIIAFLEDEKNKQYFATPLEHWTTSVLVPSGTEESIVRTVKKEMARKLQLQYPKSYFQDLQKQIGTQRIDAAESIFEEWQDALDGLFDELQLQLFETALIHAYNKKVITELTYHKQQQWLIRVRLDMVDDVVKKSKYMYTWYGYSYIKPDGSYAYYANARKDSAYSYWQRQIEKGVTVTPIISKTYSLKENLPIPQAKKYFESDLTAIFSEQYWMRWKRICELVSPVFGDKDCKKLAKQIAESYGEAAAKAFHLLCYDFDIQIS